MLKKESKILPFFLYFLPIWKQFSIGYLQKNLLIGLNILKTDEIDSHILSGGKDLGP
jgi:hypothetical protein